MPVGLTTQGGPPVVAQVYIFGGGGGGGGGAVQVWLQVAVVNVPVALSTHLALSQAYLGGAGVLPQNVSSEPCPTESTRVSQVRAISDG